MADLEIRIKVEHLTPLDDPERGWCCSCCLPSLLSWHLAFAVAQHLELHTLTLCPDCGREDWT